MDNPFLKFGKNSQPTQPQMSNTPFGNVVNIVNQCRQFCNSFQGGSHAAEQQVKQMMQQNPQLQNLFNQYADVANTLMQMMGKR